MLDEVAENSYKTGAIGVAVREKGVRNDRTGSVKIFEGRPLFS